jgi:transcription termination factor NusB
MTSSTSRKQARRDAMVILYQHDITGGALEELYNNLEREEGHQLDDFTRQEVEGVLAEGAALDEAVALAKRFCSPEAGVLVNGILGRIANERRE